MTLAFAAGCVANIFFTGMNFRLATSKDLVAKPQFLKALDSSPFPAQISTLAMDQV